MAGIAAAILSITAVQAVPITGGVDFLGISSTSASGGVTTFSPADPWIDLGGTGAYSHTSGALVIFNPVSYTGTGAGATLAEPVDPLWTFSVLGVTYSFDLTSLLSADITANSIDLSGIGTAYISGYDPTAATWSLQGSGANERFQIDFSATSMSPGTGGGSSGSSVPDGGATVAMLGIALGACCLFARKLQCA
jgi:hypothetical protein